MYNYCFELIMSPSVLPRHDPNPQYKKQVRLVFVPYLCVHCVLYSFRNVCKMSNTCSASYLIGLDSGKWYVVCNCDIVVRSKLDNDGIARAAASSV